MNPAAILEKIEAKYQEINNKKVKAENDNRRIVNEKAGLQHNLSVFTGTILQNLSFISDNVIFYRFIKILCKIIRHAYWLNLLKATQVKKSRPCSAFTK